MFEECLEKWKQIENEFVIRLIKKQLKILKIEFSDDDVQFKDYDLKITYKKDWKPITKTFEIKSDDKSLETWNICFEYACNWEPSWIFNSKADFIVYQICWNFYIKERWKLITNLNFVEKKSVEWWDWNRAKMFIVNKDKLLLLFNKI